MRAYERLLKYVSYETTSDENSQTCPSSAKELVLADELVEELKAIGVADAHVDKDGYVYGSIPATKGAENEKTIGLIAHIAFPDSKYGYKKENIYYFNENGLMEL